MHWCNGRKRNTEYRHIANALTLAASKNNLMFKRLFRKNKTERLSKIEYWKKWEIFDLFDNLHAAKKLLTDIASEKQSSQLFNFKNQFIEEIYELEGDNVADFTRIWEWFAPTKEWEMLVGQPGKELGINIFRITDNWKRKSRLCK